MLLLLSLMLIMLLVLYIECYCLGAQIVIFVRDVFVVVVFFVFVLVRFSYSCYICGRSCSIFCKWNYYRCCSC